MSGNGMHTAPNPGPPIAKVHDISFEKDKTLMRTISTEGAGTEAREGAVVTIHLTISQPGEDGELYEIYRSKDTHPTGLKFELGRSAYSEAVERTLMFCKPGSVIDSLCTDPDTAADHELGVFARAIPEAAWPLWMSPRGPIGVAQGAMANPPMMAPKPEDIEPPWRPSKYAILFHVLLDSVGSEGGIPMYMDAYERLDWVRERKEWATQLYKKGWYVRAKNHYKKAMLDLEVPCNWLGDKFLIERNNLRTALHLNCAACALKVDPNRPFPHLQSIKNSYDIHHDAIYHCTRVLDVDKHNVKALYRRAQNHLLIPSERHINGLQYALEDLQHALEVDPQNAEVKKELKRAKDLQRKTDAKAAGMFSKMIGSGVEI